VNSEELRFDVATICYEAGKRITGVGDAQYSQPHPTESEDTQRHEEESLEDHFQGLEEELLDTIN